MTEPEIKTTDNRWIETALEEYRTLWSYYNNNLSERHRLNEYFFKTVTIPAFIIGPILLISKEKIGASELNLNPFLTMILNAAPLIVGITLFLVSLSGFFIFRCHVKETQVGKDYIKSINIIRKRLIEHTPELNGILKLPKHNRKNSNFPPRHYSKILRYRRFFGIYIWDISRFTLKLLNNFSTKITKASFSRIMITCIINIGTLSLSISLIFSHFIKESYDFSAIFIFSFLFSLIFHFYQIFKHEI